MPRDHRLYLDDIVESVAVIKEDVSGLDAESFANDRKTQDAVIRNLEIFGEAARNLPQDLKQESPGVDWRKIVGLGNILPHACFGVRIPIIGGIVRARLDSLERACREMIGS